MNYCIDTIVAVATPLGRGGIGILRISGKLVPSIALKLLGKLPDPRKAEYLPFLLEDGSVLERVIALFFPEPNSFTGENVLEVHSHGGIIIVDLLLNRILEISSDIRLANPGEFTERAFLNDKIDLIQAESVADIIDATSYQAARSASNSLQGIFSKKVHVILEKIIDLRVYIESSIDFSDEEIDIISSKKIQFLLQEIIKDVNSIYKSACYGLLLKEGIQLVIAGEPNAGKSSLFNALIDNDRAIVSSISGTTRDTLCENMQLNGISFYITDTAGLNESSVDEIELIGMQRTRNALLKADHILWVVDSSDSNSQNYSNILCSVKKIFLMMNRKVPVTIIFNKSDLSLKTIGIDHINGYICITLSVLLNKGIDLLRKHLYDCVKSKIQGYSYNCVFEENQSSIIARRRHLEILKEVAQCLVSAQNQLNCNDMVLFAEDLRLAHDKLNSIFGKFTSEELLKKIFSKFCIGK